MRSNSMMIAKLAILGFGVIGMDTEEAYFAYVDYKQDQCIAAIPKPTAALPSDLVPDDLASAGAYYDQQVDYWSAQVKYDGKVEDCYQDTKEPTS